MSFIKEGCILSSVNSGMIALRGVAFALEWAKLQQQKTGNEAEGSESIKTEGEDQDKISARCRG